MGKAPVSTLLFIMYICTFLALACRRTLSSPSLSSGSILMYPLSSASLKSSSPSPVRASTVVYPSSEPTPPKERSAFSAVKSVQTVHEPVSYTHLRAHETRHDLVCRLLL